MADGVVIRANVFSVQVCVPKDWTDEQVIDFAEREYPCGTRNGWFIRRDEEYERLRAEGRETYGSERVECADDSNRVHILLDA